MGYLATIPERFWVDGAEFSAYWLKGFWVDPEFRSGPVGFEILKCAVRELGVTAVSTVAPEARRLFEAQGLTERGVLFNRLRLLDPAKVFSRLDAETALRGVPRAIRLGLQIVQGTGTSRLAGAFLSAATAVATMHHRGARGLSRSEGWDALPEEALTALWMELRGSIRAGAVRDGGSVRRRYSGSDLYAPVGVWRDEILRGWAVVRRPSAATSDRLKGIAVASLSDLLFPVGEGGVGDALLRAAEFQAKQLGADALLCSGSHPALAQTLSRRGFFPIPGNVHFMARDDGERSFPKPIESWWLTRGDAQSDGSF